MASNTQTLPIVSPGPQPGPATGSILALDLGTSMGWALRLGTDTHSGTVSFRPSRYDGGGMRYLRFRSWQSARGAQRPGACIPPAVRLSTRHGYAALRTGTQDLVY